MADLKDAWKQTAKSFIIAASDLGVSVCATVKAGVDAAVDWARKDNPHIQTDGVEIPDEGPAEAPTEPDKSSESPTE